VQRLNDGSVIVEGAANIRDLNKEMKWKLPTDGPKTLSGLVIEQLGDIPRSQLCLQIVGHRIEVLESSENMVKRLKFLPTGKAKAKKK